MLKFQMLGMSNVMRRREKWIMSIVEARVGVRVGEEGLSEFESEAQAEMD
jgi:hypothetical protein